MYFLGEHSLPCWNPIENGFDASVPHTGRIFAIIRAMTKYLGELARRSFYSRIFGLGHVYSYENYVKYWSDTLCAEFLQYPCILPNWDNTPRSGKNGYVLTGSTPELFRVVLKESLALVADHAPDKRVVFVKSWNEWAEGNYLEPDQLFGRKYLDVLRKRLRIPAANLGLIGVDAQGYKCWVYFEMMTETVIDPRQRAGIAVLRKVCSTEATLFGRRILPSRYSGCATINVVPETPDTPRPHLKHRSRLGIAYTTTLFPDCVKVAAAVCDQIAHTGRRNLKNMPR